MGCWQTAFNRFSYVQSRWTRCAWSPCFLTKSEAKLIWASLFTYHPTTTTLFYISLFYPCTSLYLSRNPVHSAVKKNLLLRYWSPKFIFGIGEVAFHLFHCRFFRINNATDTLLEAVRPIVGGSICQKLDTESVNTTFLTKTNQQTLSFHRNRHGLSSVFFISSWASQVFPSVDGHSKTSAICSMENSGTWAAPSRHRLRSRQIAVGAFTTEAFKRTLMDVTWDGFPFLQITPWLHVWFYLINGTPPFTVPS